MGCEENGFCGSVNDTQITVSDCSWTSSQHEELAVNIKSRRKTELPTATCRNEGECCRSIRTPAVWSLPGCSTV
jgi:hypothetical protein